MARRFPAPGLTAFLLAALLAVTSCGAPSEPETRAEASAEADPELSAVAKAMQKTILEGAVAGAALGGAVTLGNDGKSRSRGISIGGLVGATAGTYVAFIQRKYILRERRLREIREDLDENSGEIAATIAVMRRVLARQEAELAAIRASAEAGTAPPAAVETEVAEARANLAEMERAVAGAANRRAEFAEARGLVAAPGGGSEIDPELATLSTQIAEMRAIAGDLAGSL